MHSVLCVIRQGTDFHSISSKGKVFLKLLSVKAQTIDNRAIFAVSPVAVSLSWFHLSPIAVCCLCGTSSVKAVATEH